MGLQIGTKLGAYEILAPLGAGGMGEVYRARDTRLGRDIALKVLPEAFARDAERMARLRREAQVLASLNHPNIAAIYGFEDSGATHALVMELVEGPTLSARIKQGAIPVEEALPVARQIADALEYAHERGIVHRDLKPGNIKLTDNDAVKVLDFGLAKAVEGDVASMDISSSPTISRMATQAGIILGTAAYMSPEQAKGKLVDRRTDIWAFGCVLYEILTGKMAFSGETVTDTLAAILKSEPDWSQLPSSTPAHVRVLLRRCLQKDPRQRLRDIGDARISLEEVLSGSQESFTAAGVKFPLGRRALPWSAGVLAGALLAAVVAWKILARVPDAPMHFSAVTNFAGVQAQPALSPDGRSVAFVSNRDGRYNIYVGLTGGGSLIHVTNDANLKSRPEWSPDGTTLAYARLNDSGLWDIWEVPALGGTPRRVILNATDPAWSPDGRSLAYENLSDRGIWISGTSGENAHQVAATANDPEGLWRNSEPRFSPDGRDIAFASRPTGPYGELEVVNLESGKIRALTHSNAMALSPAWSPDSVYIYFASSSGGTLNIWKIPARGGDPEQVTSGQGDDAQLDVSSDGKRIVFSTWRTNTNIAQLDLMVKSGQQGMKLLTTDPARNQNAPAYSPDGKYLAYFSNLKGVENESIWISSADGSNPVQLVRDKQINVFPLWSPDSQRIVYRSEPAAGSEGDNSYQSIPVSGGVPDTILKNATGDFFDVGASGHLLFWNSDGKVETLNPKDSTHEILGRLPIASKWVPLRLSPDGRRVAYIVTPGRENDPNAGLWVSDFKSSPKQVFRGWVLWYARGPHDSLYLLAGQADLGGALWKVGWDGRGLERILASIPISCSYWEDPAQNPQDYFDVSPDGKRVAFESQSVLSANIGMITNVR